jgi:predicted transcriptional regulator
MGQQDVYNLLKNHPNEWFTSRDISKEINISVGSVTVCIKRLRESNEVLYKARGKRVGKRTQYLYKFKK